MSTSTKVPTEYGSHSSRNLMANLDREEKGFAAQSSETAVGDQQNHSLHHRLHLPRFHRHKPSATNNNTSMLPPNDKLRVFRALTGIESPPGLAPEAPISRNPFSLHKKPTVESTRGAANIGIYSRIIESEAIAAKRYRYFSTLINTCLGIQIVVAAALTAIGAARGPYKAITAFGAINTIMAGILTYLKGSGLPGREKFFENEWAKVRMYIEQREREFCLIGCQLDVEEEIDIIERMFRDVRKEMEGGSGEARGQTNDGEGGMAGERRRRRLISQDWKRVEREEVSSESVVPAPAPAHVREEEQVKAAEAYDGNEKN